jgi:hypothetical protein
VPGKVFPLLALGKKENVAAGFSLRWHRLEACATKDPSEDCGLLKKLCIKFMAGGARPTQIPTGSH